MSTIKESSKEAVDHKYRDGFGCGLTLGVIIGAAAIGIASVTKEIFDRKELIKNGVGEYRIDKRTGETTFYIFQIESGKVW
jgi:hypothetical protein